TLPSQSTGNTLHKPTFVLDLTSCSQQQQRDKCRFTGALPVGEDRELAEQETPRTRLLDACVAGPVIVEFPIDFVMIVIIARHWPILHAAFENPPARKAPPFDAIRSMLNHEDAIASTHDRLSA